MHNCINGYRNNAQLFVSIPGHTVMSSWLYLTKFPLWPLYRKDLLVLYQNAYQVQIVL